LPCGRVRCLRPSPTYIKIRYVPVRHKISTHMFKTRFISRYFIILCSRKCCRGIRRTASSSIAADESDHTLYTHSFIIYIHTYACLLDSPPPHFLLSTVSVCVCDAGQKNFLQPVHLFSRRRSRLSACIFICVCAHSAIYIVSGMRSRFGADERRESCVLRVITPRIVDVVGCRSVILWMIIIGTHCICLR
jgi:hypothetical protein